MLELSPYIFHTRVSYCDIGRDLCLSLSGVMRMMQEAAIIHSDQSGYSVMDVERTRVVWLLVQWRVRMFGKVKWNEPVDVVTWPQTMEKLTSNRCFQIKNKEGELVAVADSMWLLANADSGRVMRIPAEVSAAYDLIEEGVFDVPMSKLSQKVGEKMTSGMVLRRDLDTNHHVNNLVYLEYARDALPETVRQADFREVVVHYHRQLLLGDVFHCYYEKSDNGHLVQICGEDTRHVHCSILFCE